MGIRVNIIKYLLAHGKENRYRIARALKTDVNKITKALSALEKEGLIEIKIGNAILVQNKIPKSLIKHKNLMKKWMYKKKF